MRGRYYQRRQWFATFNTPTMIRAIPLQLSSRLGLPGTFHGGANFSSDNAPAGAPSAEKVSSHTALKPPWVSPGQRTIHAFSRGCDWEENRKTAEIVGRGDTGEFHRFHARVARPEGSLNPRYNRSSTAPRPGSAPPNHASRSSSVVNAPANATAGEAVLLPSRSGGMFVGARRRSADDKNPGNSRRKIVRSARLQQKKQHVTENN